LSRGSGPASYPTKPLGSYHVSPTTTWMDPPSTSDVRRWGALLTTGWARLSGSPKDLESPPLVNTSNAQPQISNNNDAAGQVCKNPVLQTVVDIDYKRLVLGT
jgi:hypothetical protein